MDENKKEITQPICEAAKTENVQEALSDEQLDDVSGGAQRPTVYIPPSYGVTLL